MKPQHRRKFTDDEKRAIVEDAAIRGTNVVLQEYRLSYSVFARWKVKFQPAEMKEAQHKQKLQQHLKELMGENELLKRIIANQALELQIKTEQLNNA